MTIYNFQLTYSISPYGNSSNKENKAAEARRLIKNIAGWESVDEIETTLVGEISFIATGNSEKRKKGQSIVEDKVRTLFEREEVLDHTHSYFSLMIDGLGKHIEFSM
ncbi:hypothetical protein C9J12_29145 [Photobacterium frigidiphilum]|uniref:Uncharacterized protein n=1 Tax=Photobacterium frigidiphilum TaxID=264736 RepID=A0A2T3J5Z7_9GAMM|nr:hypothetical protein [Photobacterium frigidiphilum]PSU42141.1 hypothetical protein C9J12_29145 [Photobacterium frigidiphilum]